MSVINRPCSGPSFWGSYELCFHMCASPSISGVPDRSAQLNACRRVQLPPDGIVLGISAANLTLSQGGTHCQVSSQPGTERHAKAPTASASAADAFPGRSVQALGKLGFISNLDSPVPEQASQLLTPLAGLPPTANPTAIELESEIHQKALDPRNLSQEIVPLFEVSVNISSVGGALQSEVQTPGELGLQAGPDSSVQEYSSQVLRPMVITWPISPITSAEHDKSFCASEATRLCLDSAAIVEPCRISPVIRRLSWANEASGCVAPRDSPFKRDYSLPRQSQPSGCCLCRTLLPRIRTGCWIYRSIPSVKLPWQTSRSRSCRVESASLWKTCWREARYCATGIPSPPLCLKSTLWPTARKVQVIKRQLASEETSTNRRMVTQNSEEM